MNTPKKSIPFVDLQRIHEPLQSEINQAIQKVIESNDFVLGEILKEFEGKFAHACGVKYGVGVACGTQAIELGLVACGINPNDQVIVPANTFVATLIGIIRAGAQPILVDCEIDTGLINLSAIEAAITPQTRAIIPVHLYGQMVSPLALLKLAKKHNVLIFEDAAQAHLAMRDNYQAGSVGIAGAFSFYPSKNLGSFGDGGMVVTNDYKVVEKLVKLRNYGAEKKYYHTELGTNSRLDNLQAAILGVKLPYLKKWNLDRFLAAKEYNRLLAPLKTKGIIPLSNQSDQGHVYHLYVIRITKNCQLDRFAIQQHLAAHGIETGIHYPLPCHLQPAYQKLGYQIGDFPHTEMLSKQILSLPMYPGINYQEIAQIVTILEELII